MNVFDLWDFGNPALSEERFRDAADDAETDEEEGMALSQLARVLGLQGKFDEARETLGYAWERVGDEGSAAGVQCLLESGRLENSSGNPSSAMPLFARALEVAKGLGMEYAACDAAHMLAIAAPPLEQIAYGKQALEMVRATSDERARKWVGPIMNNLGWTLLDMNRPDEALPYFRESLAFRLAQGLEMPIRVACYSLCTVLRHLGQYDEALVVLREALETKGFEGYLNEEIGECLFGMGQVEEARSYFALAYGQLSGETDLVTSEPGRMAKILAKA